MTILEFLACLIGWVVFAVFVGLVCAMLVTPIEEDI